MFDLQATGIDRHREEIMSAIEPQVIQVLASNGNDRPVAELAFEILGAVDLEPQAGTETDPSSSTATDGGDE